MISFEQDAVLAHLAEVGPLAVNVDASQWDSYTGVIVSCLLNENVKHSYYTGVACILVFYKTQNLRKCYYWPPGLITRRNI